VAYRFLAIFKDLEAMTRVTQIVATGTALQSSAVWVQILADVLGRPITLPAEGELTSRGAAIVAMEQLGAKRAARPLRIAKTFTPDGRAHEIYRAAAARQQELIERLENRERMSTPKGQLRTPK